MNFMSTMPAYLYTLQCEKQGCVLNDQVSRTPFITRTPERERSAPLLVIECDTFNLPEGLQKGAVSRLADS